jgi:hypothetical protein
MVDAIMARDLNNRRVWAIWLFEEPGDFVTLIKFNVE